MDNKSTLPLTFCFEFKQTKQIHMCVWIFSSVKSHYLSQSWPRAVSPYGATMPQQVEYCRYLYIVFLKKTFETAQVVINPCYASFIYSISYRSADVPMVQGAGLHQLFDSPSHGQAWYWPIFHNMSFSTRLNSYVKLIQPKQWILYIIA